MDELAWALSLNRVQKKEGDSFYSYVIIISITTCMAIVKLSEIVGAFSELYRVRITHSLPVVSAQKKPKRFANDLAQICRNISCIYVNKDDNFSYDPDVAIWM